jgi:integrase
MASVRKRTWTSPTGEAKTAWFVDYYDNRGDRQRRHFANKKSADAFRISIEGQLATGIYRPDARRLTVRAACQAFIAHCEGRLRRDERMTRKMLTVYRGYINNHILPSLANWRLSQLTAKTIGDFRDELRDNGVTVPTTRKILATLHSILEYAISQDWIAANAARTIKVIGPRNEGSKKIVPPDQAELSRIVSEANSTLRLMILFAASTGARAGEQWAARWGDVDFDNAQLRISRRVDAYGEEGPPKTAAGIRTVPLSAQLVSALKAWKLQSRFSKPEDLIFANQQGGYIGHDNLIKRQFIPLFANAKSKRFNWHGLRHFAVSTWIEAGLSPKTVQTFAGHASLQVTMDRYGHLFPSDDHKRAMDRIATTLFTRTPSEH